MPQNLSKVIALHFFWRKRSDVFLTTPKKPKSQKIGECLKSQKPRNLLYLEYTSVN